MTVLDIYTTAFHLQEKNETYSDTSYTGSTNSKELSNSMLYVIS